MGGSDPVSESLNWCLRTAKPVEFQFSSWPGVRRATVRFLGR